MNPSFDLTGSQVRQAREYPISESTVIQNGQAVVLIDGKVYPATAASDVLLGVAAENHLGVPDAMNTRSNGRLIKVYDSPTQIYVCKTPEYTAQSGDTASFTCAAKTAGLKNGFVKLVDKEPDSTNTDALGMVYEITGSTSAGVVTLNRGAENGRIGAGDVFEVYPPVGYKLGKLNSRLCGVTLDSEAANSALAVVGHITELGLTELKLKTIFA